MTIVNQTIAFDQGGVRFDAQASWDDAIVGPRPLVLVAGTFMGRTPFEDDKAAKLAALGFVGFAIDLYGVETRPTSVMRPTWL